MTERTDANRPKTSIMFVQDEHENIGIEYLSAMLKQHGYEVSLSFYPRPFNNGTFRLFKGDETAADNAKMGEQIKRLKPTIVAFSPFSAQYAWCIQKARYIRQHFPEIFILFGGIHATSVPELVIIEKCVDALFVGESDTQLLEFLQKFQTEERYSVKSLWIKKEGAVLKNEIAPLVKELDTLPFPDKQMFYQQMPQAIRGIYFLMGGRGCPYSCSYCANNIFNKLYKGQRRLRFRTPESIIQELLWAKDAVGYSHVHFIDDVLTIDKERLKKLTGLYKERIQTSYSCFMHPNLIDEETILLLKNSGCTWLQIGVQSASEEYRNKYLHRHETNANIRHAAALCNQHSLMFSFDHILNLPGETREHLLEAVNLYNDCRPTIINFGALIYLPGTKIIDYGLEQNILTGPDIQTINAGGTEISNITRFSGQSGAVNTSVFALMFILITLLPKSAISFLVRHGFCNIQANIPSFVLIPFKILSKIKARQAYVYWNVIKYTLVYGFQKLIHREPTPPAEAVSSK